MKDNSLKKSTEDSSAEHHLYAEYEWIFGGKAEKGRCGAYGVFTVTNDITKCQHIIYNQASSSGCSAQRRNNGSFII